MLHHPLVLHGLPAGLGFDWAAVIASVTKSETRGLSLYCRVAGSWCAVAFWAELQLFGDIHYSTAGKDSRQQLQLTPDDSNLPDRHC
jgi:hypothetical protein